MHVISSYHGNKPTPCTHPSNDPHKQTGPITIHRAAASAQCSVITYMYVTDLSENPQNQMQKKTRVV